MNLLLQDFPRVLAAQQKPPYAKEHTPRPRHCTGTTHPNPQGRQEKQPELPRRHVHRRFLTDAAAQTIPARRCRKPALLFAKQRLRAKVPLPCFPSPLTQAKNTPPGPGRRCSAKAFASFQLRCFLQNSMSRNPAPFSHHPTQAAKTKLSAPAVPKPGALRAGRDRAPGATARLCGRAH